MAAYVRCESVMTQVVTWGKHWTDLLRCDVVFDMLLNTLANTLLGDEVEIAVSEDVIYYGHVFRADLCWERHCDGWS